MQTIHLGLIGCGVVGTGLLQLLRDHADTLEARLGAQLHVAKIAVRDPSRPRADIVPNALLTQNVTDILDDPAIDIVVELMGGVDRAFEVVETALQRGKHVVTANKALLAERGAPLFALAEERGLEVRVTRLEHAPSAPTQLTLTIHGPEGAVDGTTDAADRTRRIVGRVYGDLQPRVVEITATPWTWCRWARWWSSRTTTSRA